MPYVCELCSDNKPATFLLTPLTGGDTMAVGEECTAVALAGMLAAYMGVPADKLYELIEQLAQPTDSEAPGTDSGPGVGIDGGEDTEYSAHDLGKGLCGYIHEDGDHCHRKHNHSGKHSKVKPDHNGTLTTASLGMTPDQLAPKGE